MRAVIKGAILECHMVNGLAHGLSRTIYSDGSYSVGRCKRDERVGVHIWYSLDDSELDRRDYGAF